MKGILEFLLENNRWVIVLIILLILIGGGIYNIQRNKIDKLNNKYDSEVKLKNALIDTVHTYKNKEGQWVSEKLTIQGRLENLLEDSARLTASQKSLLNQVNNANKKNTVITAALIRAEFIIDSLVHSGGVLVDTTNKIVEFTETNNPDINYDFKVFGVLPYPVNSKPSLLIKNLTLPNEQFIKFQFDKNKRANYPISFSVTNTNKYIKVYDVNSYAIPDLDKNEIDPTGWEKFSSWMNRNENYIKWFGGGVVVGGGAGYLLTR
ncbi:MAG: hypothetical protein PF487_07330 [Bacteroidales bacterium]|jgi:hypothetical protein|nr:hypothetical protein [Bacteroidales bacterium]